MNIKTSFEHFSYIMERIIILYLGVLSSLKKKKKSYLFPESFKNTFKRNIYTMHKAGKLK